MWWMYGYKFNIVWYHHCLILLTYTPKLFFQSPLPKTDIRTPTPSALTDSPSFKTEQSENAERGTCPSIRNEQKSMKYGDSQLALAVRSPLDSTGAYTKRPRVWSLGLGRFPRGGHGNPLSTLIQKNPMDREGVWQAAVRGVAKSSTWLKELSVQAHTMHAWLAIRKEEWDWKLGNSGVSRGSLSWTASIVAPRNQQPDLRAVACLTSCSSYRYNYLYPFCVTLSSL